MDIVSEQRRGLKYGIKMRCRICNLDTTVWTEPSNSDDKMNANTSAVAGIMSFGGGCSNMIEFSSTSDIPSLSANTFTKEREILCKEWEVTALKELQAAVKEEGKLDVRRGDIDGDGIPLLTVVVDGSWEKRFCQTNYASLSGVGLQKDASQGDKFSTDAGSSVDVESDTNLLLTAAASDMVVELDPTTFVPSDSEEPDPSDLCEAGPSSRVEPDSSMMEEEHLAMTCEVYPVKTGPDSPSMDIKIKEEPEDTFKQDILSATVERELYHFSKDTRAAISIEESLFQPPVLIKEEPVSSEEDP